MYRVFLMLFVLVIVAWLILRLMRSQKLEKLCNDLDSGKMVDITTSSQDTIKDISKAETGLGKTAALNKKEVDKLKKESDGINEFLNKRGEVKEEGS